MPLKLSTFDMQGDELEHVKTMAACQALNAPVLSPHDRAQRKKEKAVMNEE